MDFITWPVAIAIIGCLVTVLTFVNAYIRKDEKPWIKDIHEDRRKDTEKYIVFERRITVGESTLTDIKQRLEEIKSDVVKKDIDTQKQIDKLEEKVEKLTQLIIDLFHKFN